MEINLAIPIHLLLVLKKPHCWTFYEPTEIFYNPTGEPVNLVDIWLDYGKTEEKIKIELFRLKAGKLGFYLADLRNDRYYYCGDRLKDVEQTLIDIGIRQKDPLEPD